MATSTTTTTLFSLLVSLVVLIQATHGVTIYFHSAFEAGSSPFELSCHSFDGELVVNNRPVSPNTTLTLFGDKSSKKYKCAATRDHTYVARFDAYYSMRDYRISRVYWKADKTGWYLSYNNYDFEKKADWETHSGKV